MPRPKKTGLDYFPLDVDIFNDEKVVPVTVEFGVKGQIAIVHLLCAIYRNGYFIEWGDRLKYKLAQAMPSVSPELLDSVVARLAKWGFFDLQTYEQHSVLTSIGIQRRYFGAIRRRCRLQPDCPYLLFRQEPPQPKPAPKAAPPAVPQPQAAPPAQMFAPPPAYSAPISGQAANAECMAKFFADSNRAHLDALCMRFSLTPETEGRLREWAEAIVAEWNIAEKAHRDYSDWASHMVKLMWEEKVRDDKSKPKAKPRAAQPPAQGDYSFAGGFGGQDT